MKKPIEFPHKMGPFQLGHINVDLYATDDEGGGSFCLDPSEKSLPNIRVDVDYDTWGGCVATLLHEAFEFEMARRDKRFKRSDQTIRDHGDYLFVFDHPEFTQVCATVGLFVTAALPELADAYNQFHKKRS